MLKKLTIRKKLFIQVIVSIITIGVLSLVLIYDHYKEACNLKRIEETAYIVRGISNLIHETQKERGMTAGYLGTRGKKFKTRLPGQRKLTDERFLKLQKVLESIEVQHSEPALKAALQKALDDFAKIGEIRKKVDGLQIDGSKAIGYYTGMNKKFLDVIVVASTMPSTPTITKQIIAYLNFLQAKERAGIEGLYNIKDDMRYDSNELHIDINSYGKELGFTQSGIIKSLRSYLEIDKISKVTNDKGALLEFKIGFLDKNPLQNLQLQIPKTDKWVALKDIDILSFTKKTIMIKKEDMKNVYTIEASLDKKF